MEQVLYERLKPVVRRIQFRRVAIAFALTWFCAAAVAAWLYYLNWFGNLDPSRFLWLLIGGTFFLSIVAAAIAILRMKSVEQVAEDVERQYPDLDASLITAIEQQPLQGERLGFLQQDVLRRAVTHSFVNRWPAIIPGWHLVAAPIAGLFGLIAFASAMVCLAWYTKPIPPDKTIPFADAAVDKLDFEITVEPGNTAVERGTSLLVLARFNQAFPPEVTLVFADEDGIESQLPMSKSLDDPVFGARVSAVDQPITYRIDYAKQHTGTYTVSVFDVPKLIRADATLKYPTYTELKAKTVQDFRRLNAVQGTKAELTFFVNKLVTAASLVPRGTDDCPVVGLKSDSNDPKKLTALIQMDQSRKYELQLVDDAGRRNRTPPKFVLNVLENRPPDLKLLAPGRDIQASPLEEVQMSANVWDDFGLKSIGLNFGIPGQENTDVVIERKPTTRKRKQVDHLLELEELKAQPDDLVSYYFWAEDIGPDGELRRVSSDMYFAEVRHFDEIYRQGQAPPAGQQPSPQQQGGQNARQAQELGELQKQIINATWKLIRREKAGNLSAEFGDDTELIAQSQASAIEKLVELAEQLEDQQSKSFIESARTLMNEAVLHLTQASRDADYSALKPALSSEQAAYQALLKLRAREHEVVRQQQQAGQASQSQNNRAQQQLEQLNLKEDENRYENEKTAQEQNEQSQQQQEDRQVLSRLRELARRQTDLNERVKELQSALEEAKTEEERKEIERRLKSLREQQEQMLRDADELLDRMKNQENQQRMAEESEQLEQTRENLQRASEALQKGQVSRAAAEGTRAQRDLEELRDEFQNRTAGQFTEQMRQMRNQAQELEQKQQDIAQELADQPVQEKKTVPSLRDDDDTPNLNKQLAEQQESVDKLRTEMRETIEEAEPFEPLLAEELYDTYRKSEESRPGQALESARRSLERGWVDDARTEEERAREGIEQLREGIEKAAESVLGDETEALKAAQKTLRDLNQELRQEINESDPPQEPRDGQSAQQNGQQQSDGERRDGEQEDQQQNNQRGQSSEPSNQQSEDQQEQRGQEQNQTEEAPQEGQSGQGQSKQQRNGEPSGANPGDQPDGGKGQQNDEERDDADRMRQQIRNLGTDNLADSPREGDINPGSGGGGNKRMLRPISGEDFRDWSDRLRDVEEMIADPDLRAEASRIREQAREIRKDSKRHSAKPNWDLVKLKVAKPLGELQDRVAEEIMRRGSKNALVPLDRDPVPAEFQDAVRRYYERLGSGQ